MLGKKEKLRKELYDKLQRMVLEEGIDMRNLIPIVLKSTICEVRDPQIDEIIKNYEIKFGLRVAWIWMKVESEEYPEPCMPGRAKGMLTIYWNEL